ncbi:MAG: hypothetical protein V4548_06260 [Bacteroidota bacterium]
MQRNYKLTSYLGEIFVYVIYIIGIGFTGYLIYSIIIKDTSGILTCLLLILFFYFAFITKILKFKNVSFDNKSIYLEDENISLKEVKSIKRGEIIFQKNGKEVKINYNYFYGENYKMLTEFYETENKL